jgi:predicted flap endonuclease-1-like 5' DNA nuclease
MNERFTSDLVFILIVLLVTAILGYIIGYLSKKAKYAKALAALQSEIDSRQSEIVSMQNEMKQLKLKLEACLQQKEKLLPFNAAAAKDIFKSKIVENDLKIVEGIGGKIESILNKRGIVTWLQLSQTSADTIKEILLSDGGPSYAIHEPKTWPSQALLAHEGKWAQLKEYQDQLTAGR